MEFAASFDATNGLVVKLIGELDIAGDADAQLAFDEAFSHGSIVTVDLSELTSMDSTGLGVLVAAHQRAASRAGSIRLSGAPEHVKRLLRTTGLAKDFGIDTAF